MHPYKRSQRVSEVIKRVVSEQVLLALKLPNTAYITITDVEMAPDLRIAHIFVSYLGDEAEREPLLKTLQASEYRIKKVLAKEVRLKFTPQLQFRYDDTYEKGSRIDQLLNNLHHDEGSGE